MPGLCFEDILIHAGMDEFGSMTGYVEFPYFQTQIEVVCSEGVTAEYAAASIRWLGEVDEVLVKEICQYAMYYLQDELESTSKGELLGEDIQQIKDPLEILHYMAFGSLYIKPPMDAALPVLNLGGGCDWQEDEGLQCLIKDGHVVYLGSWNDMDVWNGHLLDDDQYLTNYVLYPMREALQQKVAERLKQHPPKKIPHLEFAMNSPVRKFVEILLAGAEHCTREEAWAKVEGTRLMALLQEDHSLAWEDAALLYQCYCMERDQGAVDMEVWLMEQLHG